eukprot:GEZU01009740.1.p1 GENE.GEZU01009740.1~~GEZU01009740.1.p1  ORF type:complete len:355 (+),score=66.72 GEZU01009740.1:2-1066(+)
MRTSHFFFVCAVVLLITIISTQHVATTVVQRTKNLQQRAIFSSEQQDKQGVANQVPKIRCGTSFMNPDYLLCKFVVLLHPDHTSTVEEIAARNGLTPAHSGRISKSHMYHLNCIEEPGSELSREDRNRLYDQICESLMNDREILDFSQKASVSYSPATAADPPAPQQKQKQKQHQRSESHSRPSLPQRLQQQRELLQKRQSPLQLQQQRSVDSNSAGNEVSTRDQSDSYPSQQQLPTDDHIEQPTETNTDAAVDRAIHVDVSSIAEQEKEVLLQFAGLFGLDLSALLLKQQLQRQSTTTKAGDDKEVPVIIKPKIHVAVSTLHPEIAMAVLNARRRSTVTKARISQGHQQNQNN